MPYRPTRSYNVLVVDDESSLRSLLRSILSKHYAVKTTGSAIEALEIFQKGEEPFDIVLVDGTLYPMTGDQLIDAIQIIRPRFPAILMSGYTQDYLNDLRWTFLAKPFTPQTILKTLKFVLEPV